MKAGIIMSPVVSRQGSSSWCWGVNCRSSSRHSSSDSGGESLPPFSIAMTASCTREECRLCPWCGRSAGSESTLSRSRAAMSPGRDTFSRLPSVPLVLMTLSTRRLCMLLFFSPLSFFLF